jgi:endonuclease I
MRRNNKILTPLVALGVSITLSAGIFIGLNAHQNEGLKVEAASAHNLNTLYADCENAVSNNSLSSLWSAVKTASKDGYVSHSYDDLDTWYLSTDLDSRGKIHDYYSNTSAFVPSENQCGNYKIEGDCYNKEHSIPQSWWGKGTSNQGCDIYIVVPTDGKINGMRSNYPFGNVDTVTKTSNNSFSKLGYTNTSIAGYSSYVFEPSDEYKGDFARIYFYAVARWNNVNMSQSEGDTCFTNNESINYGLTNYCKDLMVEWHTQDPVSDWELTRQNRCELKQGNRNPFVDHPEYADYLWGGEPMSDDPAISLSKTSAELKVGESTSVTATLRNTSGTINWATQSGNQNVVELSASTGSTITLTGKAVGTDIVNVTCGTLSKTVSITVSEEGGGGGDDPTPTGDNYTILATDLPTSYDSDKTHTAASGITFTTNNCAHYSNSGKLQFKKSGGYLYSNNSLELSSLVIENPTGESLTVMGGTNKNPSTVISSTTNTYDLSGCNYFKVINENSGAGYCTKITIYLAESKEATSIAVSNVKTIYTQGETFVKPTVTATYDDGSHADVTSKATFTGYDTSILGEQTVTVTFGEVSTTYNINVKAPATVTSISISGTLTHPTQYVGDTFDPSGLTVTASYSDGSTSDVTSYVTWSPSTLSASTTSVTASFSEKTDSININVKVAALVSISTSGQTNEFALGDTFVYDGTCVATYENGKQQNITPDVNSSGVNMNQTGTYQVGLSYTENGVTKSTSYSVTVSEVIITNTIEECYSKNSGASVSDVYGLYVGSGDGNNPIIMNGEYGITLYKSGGSIPSTWIANETYVKVSGSINVYRNLYQISYTGTLSSVSETEGKAHVLPVRTYEVSGDESVAHKEVASRLCLVSGTVTSALSNSRATLSVNGNSVQIYVKSNYTSKVSSALSTTGKTATIKGFTNFFDSDFQIYAFDKVDTDPEYTAAQFAQNLLDMTETVCTTSAKKSSDLAPIWVTLEFEKYSTLSASEKETLQNAIGSDSGSTIQKAMARYDFIVSHYASCSDFIGRGVTFVGINNNFMLVNKESIIPVIVVISLVGITSIGAIFLLKKRKEQ